MRLSAATVLTVACVVSAGVAVGDEIGANLVPNPGFEAGDEGWTRQDLPIVRDGGVRASGEWSCRLEATGEERYPNFYWARSFDIPCEPGREYRYQVMVRARFTAGEVSPQVREVDAEGQTISYHIAEQLAPGEHDWHQASCRFFTSRRAASLQIYLVMRNCLGTAWFDNVALTEVRPEPVPPVGTGAAVSFEGSPGSLDMRVEPPASLSLLGGTRITTTGAIFSVRADESALVITARQRIGVERDAWVARITPAPGTLRPLRCDESAAILGNENLELGFQCDSLLAIAPGRDTTIRLEGRIGGAWVQNVEGNVQVTDDEGGVGVYPHVPPGSGVAGELTQEPGDLTQPGWRLRYALGPGTLLGISTYPPRAYDWRKSFDWQLAHTNAYPPDSALETWSRYVKLVTLHDAMWAGGKPRTYTGPYEVRDPDEFRRVIATCERLGMLTIPYMSPYYYVEPGVDAFLAQLTRLREEHGFHGIYYDGLYPRDWVKSYRIMRLTRAMFPDGPIYLHDSIAAPAHQYDIWCPFIDTWADIVLRGEGRVTEGAQPPYVRYVAAGYKLSNAIGMMKGSRWDLPYEEQLRWILACNGRERLGVFPGGPDASGVAHYPGEGGTLDGTWMRVYWPGLQELRERWRMAGDGE